METLDIIILVCFVPALITGLRKGLIEQLIGLASIFLGVWVAFKFSMMLSAWLQPHLNLDANVLNIIAFTILVIAVILGLAVLGKLLTKVLKLASLGWLNRLLGLLFALFKAAVIISLVIFAFDPLNAKLLIIKQETLDASVMYKALQGLSAKVFPYLQLLIENV